MTGKASWKCIFVIVWSALGTPAFGGDGRFDLVGITANMPQADAEQVIAKFNWTCTEETFDWAIVENCKTRKTDIDEVKIHYATKVDKHPVFYIWVSGTHPIRELVERVGRPPDFRVYTQTSSWMLDENVMLSHFDGEGYHGERFTTQSLIQLEIAPPRVRVPYLEQIREWKNRNAN